MAAVVGIVSGRGISIHACRANYPNKRKLSLYKPLLLSNKAEGFSYPGGCG